VYRIFIRSEAFNFSLVDPDNRREPDFFALASALDDEEKPLTTDKDAWFSGRTKQQAIAPPVSASKTAAVSLR
jgi:(1->4)-alpha-D-glucan 1-alpha-D-glucosylmutase